MKRKFETKWLIASMMVLCLVFGFSTVNAAEEYGLGDIPLDPATYQKFLKVWPERATRAIPSAYDARNYGLVTPAKDQGACGSCWAFASVGGMESHILKEYGFGPYDHSEQQLVSCATTYSGCCGGSSSALKFWETQGPIDETCFPYGESGTSCPTIRTVDCSDASSCTQYSYRVTNWHTVSATATQMKTSLYNDGPSYWRFDVYSDFSYAGTGYWYDADPGDVYVNASGSFKRGGHAVLLIGWDDTKSAFLCKNSWGETGGPNGDGTFWIAYSGHYNSLGFGMANFNLTGGPTYKYCFTSSGSGYTRKFNKKVQYIPWFVGMATGTCYPAPILGALYEGNWILIVDIPSDSFCVESVFYWGIYPGKNYDWINSSGSYGTGTLYKCAAAVQQTDNEEFGTDGPKVDPIAAKTICLEDQWGYTYDLTISGKYITGTANGMCGTYVVTGMRFGNDFSFYVDVPSDATGCNEGYLVVGDTKTLSGYWRNAVDATGTITFTKCGTLTKPSTEPGPDEKN